MQFKCYIELQGDVKMSEIFDFIRCEDFDVETINNNALKGIIKDIIAIKSLKQFHIETFDNGLYICLFDLSQLNANNIVKYFKNKNIDAEVVVDDCNIAMSWLPTTEIFVDKLEGCEQALIFYNA